MTTQHELLAFVQATTTAVNDTARLVLADWLDEHSDYQRTPVTKYPVPVGFHGWWHRHVLPRHPGDRFHYWQRPGRWSNPDILHFLGNMGDYLPSTVEAPRHRNWFDHGGFTWIADQIALVGEPSGTEQESQVTAALLQDWFGCPVTFDRAGFHSPDSRRLIVWYSLATDQPPLSNPAVAETQRFIRERLLKAPGESVSVRDAYLRYRWWMDRANYRPLTRPRFTEELCTIHPESVQGRNILGVRLVRDTAQAA